MENGVLDAGRLAQVEVVSEAVIHAVAPVGCLLELSREVLICKRQQQNLNVLNWNLNNVEYSS